MKDDAYKEIEAIGRELVLLKGILGQLSWDESTFMPAASAPERGDQTALVNGYYHNILVSDRLDRALSKLDRDRLTVDQKANLRAILHERQFHTKVSEELIAQISRQASLAQQSWIQAKASKNFKSFAPDLSAMIDLKRQLCEAVGYDHNPYDALLGEYEPELRTKDFNLTFARLREGLKNLLDRIQTSPVKPKKEILNRPLDEHKLLAFSKEVIESFGFKMEFGRVDLSAHPFCQSNAQHTDVRLTTRFVKDRPIETLFALMHEAGHGMYEQGLPAQHRGQPVSTATSMSMHESQSRWWENFVGRSPMFWQHYFPKFQKCFSPIFEDVTLEQFVLAINGVEPSLIRVSADEVTYNLHILFRTELEQDILGGKISVKDLPEAWASKSKEYLGVSPADVSSGVLQDIHWAIGIFGYFPTYTLGNLISAQVDQALRRDIPHCDELIGKSDFGSIREWHRTHIQDIGSLKTARELVESLCGEGFSEVPFLSYLESKYTKLYHLDG